MNEQRPAQQWIVKVNGVEEVRLNPGESLEIGRKPLRPLADDGMRRLDVPDGTRSMSKRHAAFSVSDQGAGSLRDLNSTNGTYVVRDDGELMRVPAQTDFLLPRATMRFQFGDVPVDFIRMETPVETPSAGGDVPNLFSYAAAGAQDQEPDAADMSVDDILDLRAGEPTGAFDASSVRSRIGALHDRAVASGTGAIIASDVPQASVPQTSEGRDLFADAIDEVKADARQAADEEPLPFGQGIAAQPGVATQSGVAAQYGDAAQQPVEAATPVIRTAATAQPGQPIQTAQPQAVAQPTATVQPQVTMAQSVSAQSVSAHSVSAQPVQSMPAAQPTAATQPIASPTAAFEPGSVFELVSRHAAQAAAAPVIEVGGHTSEQAKVTRDLAAQYDMARYPQLLPFLAMNPALYDDLYAWLAALGDQDVDAALEHNEGYLDYLKATGRHTGK